MSNPQQKYTREKLMNMTRDEFIQEHLETCNATRCKKYDNKKLAYRGLHTLEYSRRKCAKGLQRKLRIKYDLPL